jgi:hypothetical protein
MISIEDFCVGRVVKSIGLKEVYGELVTVITFEGTDIFVVVPKPLIQLHKPD